MENENINNLDINSPILSIMSIGDNIWRLHMPLHPFWLEESNATLSARITRSAEPLTFNSEVEARQAAIELDRQFRLGQNIQY